MNEEEALVRAFITPSRHARWCALLATPKGREKLRRQLAHCERDLDFRYVHRIPSGQQTVDEILKLLRTNRSGSTCAVLSEDNRIDGKRLSLADALQQVYSSGFATFLSVIPGQLAYFEGEALKARYLCVRDAKERSGIG